MMNLPENADLPISRLAACFNNTSGTYKFYWFLAILNRVEHGEAVIAKQLLFADMIAHSWFTVNYFHVSFGKQDKLQLAVEKVRETEGLTIDADRDLIYRTLTNSTSKDTMRALWYFNSEVPHRFLSPWFGAADMKQAYRYSAAYPDNCPMRSIRKRSPLILPE